VSDQALRRTDELLTELVELIETARTLPMSSSAVVPREHVLDLLDGLRETMPPEMGEARRVLAMRDDVLQRASEQAEMAVQAADERAAQLIAHAQARAAEVLEAARLEHDRLLASTTIQQDAGRRAEELRAQAQAELEAKRAEADAIVEGAAAQMEQYAARVRAEVDAYAAKLAADAEDYTDSTLAELAQTLSRAAATAEQGRVAVARRKAEGWRPAAAGDPFVVDRGPGSAGISG
jgi:hypothetical protein